MTRTDLRLVGIKAESRTTFEATFRGNKLHWVLKEHLGSTKDTVLAVTHIPKKIIRKCK